MDLARYVHALATAAIPMPQELDVTAVGCATDEAVDAVNHAADLADALRFAIVGDAAIAFANVRGNPWDLAAVVDRLRDPAVPLRTAARWLT